MLDFYKSDSDGQNLLFLTLNKLSEKAKICLILLKHSGNKVLGFSFKITFLKKLKVLSSDGHKRAR